MPSHISYYEMVKRFQEYNRANGVTSPGCGKGEIFGVVVLSSENWPEENYSLESRSYLVGSSNKAYIDGMCGYSIFAESLDHSDSCRLDYYLETERGDWKIDYCYMWEESA